MSITLKAARVNANLSRSEAAEKFNVTEKTISNWEQGKTFPNVPQIKMIEDAYSVSYSDIIFLPDATI